ncbi:hypothetical protein [Serratia proteamaculans]|uniref:hypothetical protein n=1 Tax=Serratia proteamaculans TaxID=28151 RepID=UPI0021781CE0|nr:hypothetical protein [Serratia proteamaculans]CAI1758832.1 phage lysis regulatory protein, LysB family [Serratia proteamaculans]
MSLSVLWALVKNYWPLVLIVAVFLLVFGMASRIEILKADMASVNKDNSELVTKLGSKDATIASLQAQDVQNRALVAAQQQYEQQLRQQHDILQRKYREAIKNDPCAAQPMPAAVIDLLQQNTATVARTGDKPTP